MTLAQPNRWFGLRIWVLTMAQSIRFLRFGDEGRSRKSTQDEVRAHGAIHLPQSLPASLVQSPPPFPTLLATFCPVHSIFLSPFRLLSSPASISLPSSFPSSLSLSPSLSLSLSLDYANIPQRRYSREANHVKWCVGWVRFAEFWVPAAWPTSNQTHTIVAPRGNTVAQPCECVAAGSLGAAAAAARSWLSTIAASTSSSGGGGSSSSSTLTWSAAPCRCTWSHQPLGLCR